ncbi:thermonuclease family protein [Paracoccus aestuarii]|uniref:Thermonuclease family protein n=1 Tax=Paracoccus aestuarii TaxID=453842 RepID=A0A418ZZS9_9RHOB|nr:thermonuclease family protein [Paracoccus aestuarii]RJL06017.1 thermonuclease family protein [Paracoccus aestuarii]WCQ99103.1 thermonuclease family protein [Paracoccus aestuarii]
MENIPVTSHSHRATKALLAVAATTILWGCLAENSSADAHQLAGLATVVDGDGLRLAGQTIRIHGIDAPEQSQSCAAADGSQWSCGQAATRRMSELVAGRDVKCRQTDRDHYDRVVAVCEVAGMDLGQVLVAEGLAWAYRFYSDDYVAAEDSARQRALGIWSAPNRPAWGYRAESRALQPAAQFMGSSSDSKCRIKGNISRGGERIYHVPGSRHYEATQINTSHGERWFCSVAEATAAGWRPPRSR